MKKVIKQYSFQTPAYLLLLSFLASCTGGIKKNEASDIDDIRAFLNLAASRRASDESVGQIYYIDSALQGKRLSVPHQIRVYEFKAGIYTNQLNDPAKAGEIADSMIALVESNDIDKYQAEYALANFCKGDALFSLKKYNEAYTHYYHARMVGKTSLDSCTLSEYSFRLALILFRQARYAEAADGFRSSLSENSACYFDFPRYYRIQQVLNNIGLSFSRAGNSDSALVYYQKAIDYIGQHRHRFSDREYLHNIALAVVYGNMADIHKLTGDVSSAKRLLKRSIAINSQQGHDNQDAELSQVKLAEIYSKEGHIDSMRNVLSALQAGLDTVKNPRAEMDWNRLMWWYHNKQNDHAKAYNHLTAFTVLRDSLEKEAERLKVADLSQQIGLLEKQYEIQALQKDNELKNVYLWVFILLCILAAVIVFLIFRNLKKSKKNVALLQSLNTQVNDQKLKLEQAIAALEGKNRQQERILRAVAHDLRGPVATISMLCDLVLNEEDKAARAEMVHFIKTSCNNSLELIAEILEAADESKQKELQKTEVNINQLIASTAELLQIKASAKKQKIITGLPSNDVYLTVNPDKIKRVISNLVTNAIKFSPAGSEIFVRFTQDERSNTLMVEDNGIGIPEELQPKVFDMFTEAKRKGTEGELPYGLGLSICKQIVEAHGGSIWLQSEQDKGTKFFVSLP